MRPPDGIERLTPADAWEAGHRAGRESLALSYQHDKEAREQKEGRTLDRLDAIEKALGQLKAETADNAKAVGEALRLTRLLDDLRFAGSVARYGEGGDPT